MDDMSNSNVRKNISKLSFGDGELDEKFFQALMCWRQLNEPASKIMLTSQAECYVLNKLNVFCDIFYTHQERIWSQVDCIVENNDPASLFVLCVVAFNSLDVSKIQYIVEAIVEDDKSLCSLISALNFLPKNIVDPWLERFIKSKELIHKYIALSVFGDRKENPEPYLSKIFEREDCRRHERLFGRALKIIGEVKLVDCRNLLYGDIRTDSSELAFWSMWSKVILGDRDLIYEMEGFVVHPGPMQEFAIDLVFRLASDEYNLKLIALMLKVPSNARSIIYASMVWGNVQSIPFLIQNMEIPLYARYAGRAFSFITGIDLTKKGLTLDVPVITELTFNQPSSNISYIRAVDENFSWPNIEKIKAVWQTYGNQFPKDKRLIYGKEISFSVICEHIELAPAWEREMLAMERTINYS